MATFNFNGISSDTKNIVVVDEPTFKIPERKYKKSDVSGRNGNIYALADAWEEVIIEYQILAGAPEGATGGAPDSNYNTFDGIAEWLNSANGYAKLYDSFDPNHYRMAVCVDSMEAVLGLEYYGKAKIKFRCRPERYLVTDLITSVSSINNATNHVAKPKIMLEGGGVYSLFKMAGKSLVTPTPVSGTHYESRNVASKMVVTRDISVYFVAFNSSANSLWLCDSTFATLTSLTEGAVEYSVTTGSTFDAIGLGFTMSALPDTDYTLSCEIYTSGRITVYFINQQGNAFIGKASTSAISGSGWRSGSLTFHTPQECGYIVIALRASGLGTQTGSHQFRKVMLAYGTTARPFVAYDTPSESTFTMNGTTLTFTTSGFVNAIIDCENEDIVIDGANGNPQSTLTDTNGNLSEKYLQLESGSNTCSYTGDIVNVSIDPKFWEL